MLAQLLLTRQNVFLKNFQHVFHIRETDVRAKCLLLIGAVCTVQLDFPSRPRVLDWGPEEEASPVLSLRGGPPFFFYASLSAYFLPPNGLPPPAAPVDGGMRVKCGGVGFKKACVWHFVYCMCPGKECARERLAWFFERELYVVSRRCHSRWRRNSCAEYPYSYLCPQNLSN